MAVIPCCVDLTRFRDARQRRDDLRRALGFESATVIAYLGGLGGMYLTDELAEFTAAALCVMPGVRLLAMTQSAPEPLRVELRRCGVPDETVHIRYVDPEEVPAYLGAADMAVSLIQPGFSKVACSPTKIGEYLAAGLPIASNAGIGDIDRILRASRVGVVLEEMTPDAYRRAFSEMRRWLDSDRELIDRCRSAARRWFDLDTVGGPAYVRLYRNLMGGEPTDDFAAVGRTPTGTPAPGELTRR
jgi:glycosyltransferase involved in cell wall biosynthesis